MGALYSRIQRIRSTTSYGTGIWMRGSTRQEGDAVPNGPGARNLAYDHRIGMEIGRARRRIHGVLQSDVQQLVFQPDYLYESMWRAGPAGAGAYVICLRSICRKFYDEQKHDVEWEELAKVTRCSVRFLDNVIDKTPYHFRGKSKRTRSASAASGSARWGLRS